MHNKSRVICLRCQSATSWVEEKGRGRRGRRAQRLESDGEIRRGQWNLETTRRTLLLFRVSFFLSFLYLTSTSAQFIYLSTVYLLRGQCTPRRLHPRLPVCGACLTLQLSLFSSTTWCSSSFRSLRVSDSLLSILQHLLSEISLSPVRWCWEQPSLYPPSSS